MADIIDRSGTPLVELRDMQKSFGGIKAVDHVNIDLRHRKVGVVENAVRGLSARWREDSD